MITRRKTLLMGGAALTLGLSVGCQSERMEAERMTITPGQARLLTQADGSRVSDLSGAYEGRAFTLDSPFRIASISKLLVGELARRLHADGSLDLDADVSAIIDFPLRHPQFPNTPVTLRRLIAHQSGIIDPDVYWMTAPGNIRTLLTDKIWEADVEPGKGFRYSNLNYGIAATVMEATTQTRFDQLFTDYVAKPLGLDIGFNWAGVSAEKRALGFPALRGASTEWELQIDGTETLSGSEPAILKEDGWSMDDYVPGTNGTLFSPQGGLRASVNDLAVIGREIVLKQPDLWTPGWRASDTDGRGSESEIIEGRSSEDGHFLAFGEGVYVYPEGPLPGQIDTPWVGHHGEAYGVYCGLWVVPERQQIFVHADLGSPDDGSPMMGGVPNQTELATNALRWAIQRMAG